MIVLLQVQIQSVLALSQYKGLIGLSIINSSDLRQLNLNGKSLLQMLAQVVHPDVLVHMNKYEA